MNLSDKIDSLIPFDESEFTKKFKFYYCISVCCSFKCQKLQIIL